MDPIPRYTLYFLPWNSSKSLIASCEDASHHADIRTGCDSLCHVSGVLDTAIGDDRSSGLLCFLIAVHNGCDLRYTDTCNDTGRTDRTRSDTDFNSVCSGCDQVSCCLCGCHVSGDYLQIRIMLFDETKCFEDICGMSVSGVDDDHVYVCFYQRIDTIEHVCRDADCGTAEHGPDPVPGWSLYR